MLSIKEKVKEVCRNKAGKKFLREEIIDLVVQSFPGTKRRSVIPSDYCYNRVNAGITFDFHMFELTERGEYICLGINHPYTGKIYWEDKWGTIKEVGEWQEGRFRLNDQAPELAKEKWGVNVWKKPEDP